MKLKSLQLLLASFFACARIHAAGDLAMPSCHVASYNLLYLTVVDHIPISVLLTHFFIVQIFHFPPAVADK